MGWEPIERVKGSGEPRQHPRDAALLEVSVRLSRTPPPEWQDRFKHPTGHSSLGEGTPQLNGSTVSIAVAAEEEKAGIAAIDERIAQANREYEQDVLPAIRLREEQEKRRAEEEKRRLEDARRRLKDV
jgi:hypothetical protein